VTHLLDTDTLSVLQWPLSAEHPALLANIYSRGSANVGVSIVSFHEQALGAHNRINSARLPAHMIRGYELLAQILTDFARLTVLPFDIHASDEYDRLKALNLRVGTMDLRIASIALANKLVL
jgi:tRNA(fMet)-specific endonuclease VapC